MVLHTLLSSTASCGQRKHFLMLYETKGSFCVCHFLSLTFLKLIVGWWCMVLQVIDKKVVSVKPDSPLKSPTSSVSPLKNKNENLCPKSLTITPPRKSTSTSTRSPCGGTVHSPLVKVPLNFKTWCYDTPACWEDVSLPMCDLGKVLNLCLANILTFMSPSCSCF